MELQDMRPEVSIRIEMLGFRGVKRRIRLNTPEGEIQLDVVLDLLIEIPDDRRGAHLSRSIEAVLAEEARSIEDYLEIVAGGLAQRHEYAKRVIARAKTVYYVDVELAGIKSREPVSAEVEVALSRESRIRRVFVEVTGITVCPSALDYIRRAYGETMSHMQRVRLRGGVEAKKSHVRIERIAKALFSSLSAPAITLLKRAEEAKLVREAFKRPMLIEDVVREAAKQMSLELKELEDDAVLEISAESYESIHPHDLYAYLKISLGEARKALLY